MFSIEKSNEIYERALKVIPGGSQTFSKGVSQFVEGYAPKYLEHGKGCEVTDADGNTFVDLIMACHPLVLGYADPCVNAAVVAQLNRGSSFSMMNSLEVDVAEKVVKTVPSAEMVRFGKNGADATSVAVRLARAFTGRDHIAFCGYHGWHDWFIATTDLNSGIPEFNMQLAHAFTYNDIDSLANVIEEFHPACVIMEPLTVLEPQDNFLHKVRDLCTEKGVVLIFDEIITGYRFSIGGAQELIGVTPDLTCLAKCISNGIPLSAITGKAEIMMLLEKTFFSFTYGGDCIGLAAASVAIDKISMLDVPAYLHKSGAVLSNRINKSLEKNNVDHILRCVGYPCRSVITIEESPFGTTLELKSWMQQEMLDRGILWTGYHALSYAHSHDVIEKISTAYEEIIEEFSKHLAKGNRATDLLKGEAVKPVFRKVSDFNAYIQRDDKRA